MAIEDRRRAWFNFGRVFSRGFSSFRQAMAPALLITLLLIVAPMTALILSVGTFNTSEDFTRIWESGLLAAFGGAGLLVGIASVIGQNALTCLAMNVQSRRAFSFGDSLTQGLRLFLPALGLSILVSLGTGLGMLLLIVPGLILMVMWSVALPARINDGPGVTAAMEESSNLTKGVRWQVFGMLLLTGVGLYVVSLLGTLPAIWVPQSAVKIAVAILQPLAVGISTLVTTFGPAALFHELKWGDRDPNEEATAELFA